MIDKISPMVGDAVEQAFVWVMELIVIIASSSTAWTVGVALLIVVGVFIHSYVTEPASPSIQSGGASLEPGDNVVEITISPIDVSISELSYDPAGEIQGFIVDPAKIKFQRRDLSSGRQVEISWTVKEWV